MQELVILSGPGKGSRYPLDPERWKSDELIVGRSKDSHILLADTRVSKQHSRLLHREGRWVIEDLGSRNGIYVQGERVDSAALSPGERRPRRLLSAQSTQPAKLSEITAILSPC